MHIVKNALLECHGHCRGLQNNHIFVTKTACKSSSSYFYFVIADSEGKELSPVADLGGLAAVHVPDNTTVQERFIFHC